MHCFWLTKRFSLPQQVHLAINNTVLPLTEDYIFKRENKKEKNQCTGDIICGSKQKINLSANQTETKQSGVRVSSLEPDLHPFAASGVCRCL